MKRGGLGRGLDVLLPQSGELLETVVRDISIDEIDPNASQPRRDFDKEALEQLADSRKNLRQIVAELQKRIETKGWNGLTGSYVPCGLAKPRIQEIFAALDRYRG